jgi:hypothetical protein
MLEELAWGSLSLTAITQNAMLPGSALTDAAIEEQKQIFRLCLGPVHLRYVAGGGQGGGPLHPQFYGDPI